jgi:hypothetical protein
MDGDMRLAVVDIAVTILFVALTIASSWWWALCAVSGGWIAYRQLRLAVCIRRGSNAAGH